MPINFPTNPAIGTPYTYEGVLWKWNGSGWYIVGSEVDLFGLSGAGLFFPADLTTAFGANRSFGKYGTGETILAEGKTAVTVIQEAMIAALPPTATLTSGTTIGFNQTAIGNTLNFSYTINALGASISGATLEFKRSHSPTWTTLTTTTANPGTYHHTLTDNAYATSGFNYRYTVKDSNGQTDQKGITIPIDSYIPPSAGITLTALVTSGLETTTRRERGNVITNISALVRRNSPNVQLTGWEFIYSRNGGAYQTTGFTAPVSGVGGSTTTGITQHSPGTTATSVVYKVRIRDQYQDSLGTYVDSTASSTINFIPYVFYGPTGTFATTSAHVRSLPSRAFQDSSTFTLTTGEVYTNFMIAMPSTNTLVSVFQDTFNITSAYTDNINVFAVEDYAGNTSLYNVYGITAAGAYSPSVDQFITKT